ncbi:MAG: FRG domain-containing protein [Lachnospiraceae bacterium]|nr:FRG domain-containing protein [Lachnospiraceae bacterium]
MVRLKTNVLPMDTNLKTDSEEIGIRNIADYIGRVEQYIQARSEKQYLAVFRGEPRMYPTPCRPGLFRNDALTKNKFFEKNLFDAMRQSKLTGETRYLDNAIDAQHGEFPSRLLDVSYNCLIALYFAVTPYYHQEEDESDGEDGMVFVFFIDEIFSPSAENINDNYNAIINRDREWTRSRLFCKNHKFIDHIKLGPRIIAQQGAFILFQGDMAEDLPKGMYYGIRIPGKSKKILREQLKRLFGIHTGSIYPETINLVKDLTHKSGWINTRPYSCENELRYALRQMERELDYYLDYSVSQARIRNGASESGEAYDERLRNVLGQVERVINGYREGLIYFVRDRRTWKEEGIEESRLRAVLSEYNGQLREFSDRMAFHGCGALAWDALRIEGDPER